mgnify:CR=1 FL=1
MALVEAEVGHTHIYQTQHRLPRELRLQLLSAVPEEPLEMTVVIRIFATAHLTVPPLQEALLSLERRAAEADQAAVLRETEVQEEPLRAVLVRR